MTAPAPTARLTPAQLRLEAVRVAAQIRRPNASAADLVADAQQIRDYVATGKTGGAGRGSPR